MFGCCGAIRRRWPTHKAVLLTRVGVVTGDLLLSAAAPWQPDRKTITLGCDIYCGLGRSVVTLCTRSVVIADDHFWPVKVKTDGGGAE